jgi:hypothetical protein
MNIIKAFDSAFKRAQAKHWDYIYILVDVHGTIFTPSYLNEEKYEFYPYAKEALQLLSKDSNIKLILWTSSTFEAAMDYGFVLNKNNIYFDYLNCNPEVEKQETDPETLDLSSKYYFNIGIDDKFGFEPETDWKTIYEYLRYFIK